MPQKLLHQFLLKKWCSSQVNSIIHQISGQLLKENWLPRTLKNRPIWSHWLSPTSMEVRLESKSGGGYIWATCAEKLGYFVFLYLVTLEVQVRPSIKYYLGSLCSSIVACLLRRCRRRCSCLAFLFVIDIWWTVVDLRKVVVDVNVVVVNVVLVGTLDLLPRGRGFESIRVRPFLVNSLSFSFSLSERNIAVESALVWLTFPLREAVPISATRFGKISPLWHTHTHPIVAGHFESIHLVLGQKFVV